MKFASHAAKHHPSIKVSAVATVQEAVKDADVVLVVSSAQQPILHREWLSPGTCVVLVGACRASHRYDSPLLQMYTF